MIGGRYNHGKYIKITFFLANVKVSEKGDKIVIPKEARNKFDIKPGNSLVMFGRGKKKKHLQS